MAKKVCFKSKRNIYYAANQQFVLTVVGKENAQNSSALSDATDSEIVAESEERCHTTLKTGDNNISMKRTLSAENNWKDTFQKSENEAADIMNTGNTVMDGENLNKMEKERLKKLSEATIPDVPKKQNRKNKRHKGILNYFFRFLYKDTD
ncbi:uncharacterized protein LOC118200276 isoform X2 [Stegodyphus dumicola]|uniref:uncharacterized protein LOC118200276 isoform X2 n=1 Tax=Stegodyphus dumicola TaxID=202533 RepID=UPI0015B20699|nr:uncharacterized protein LOC118200276 isoform X2 [Stegodyphus dumicola]